MSLYPIFVARDVVTHLNDVQTRSMNDFSWISQLRYYFIQELVQVKMITTTVAYAYEYLGNTGRLVITPLTDRCYRYVPTHRQVLQVSTGSQTGATSQYLFTDKCYWSVSAVTNSHHHSV